MHWTQITLAVALGVYVAAFVTIMVAVKARTGADPSGHSGGHSLAALASKTAMLLLLVAPVAYIVDARSVDWFGRIRLLEHPVARLLGIAALLAAAVCGIWGEISLGSSFRVGLPRETQPLVTYGLYRYIRNPLVLSIYLLALGTLLLAPSWMAVAGLIGSVAAYEWKIRIEEVYLRRAHGSVYDEYCRRTGKYLPKLPRTRRGASL